MIGGKMIRKEKIGFGLKPMSCDFWVSAPAPSSPIILPPIILPYCFIPLKCCLWSSVLSGFSAQEQIQLASYGS